MRIPNLPRLANTQLSRSDVNYLHYLSLHRDVKNAIATYATGKVLDIGCGNKPYENEFRERADQYLGCDIEQSSLSKVDIVCDATNIPLPSGEFDTVFSTQAIEHIAEHQQVLNEAYRLLKPGGIMIISGPFYWPPHEEPHDYFRFTQYGFEYILNKAGFTIEKIIENGGSWATTGQSLIHSMMNSTSRHFLMRLLRFLFFRLKMYRIHNSIFAWLDRIDFNTGMTMNYVIVAKK
jgi:SAM-dependent methyltransferase